MKRIREEEDCYYCCVLLISAVVHVAPVVRQQLHLTKINFEIFRREKTSVFVGREWLFRDMEAVSLRFFYHFMSRSAMQEGDIDIGSVSVCRSHGVLTLK